MCGIAGVCNFNSETVPDLVLRGMTAVIAHRGPDSEGIYVDGPIGLGHRRLAIIDLSPAGHQPMANELGDVVITYNGEVYNFQKLRVELESAGHQFHSRTDTEVIIHAYEEWGEDCVRHFNGMFAFAIWDHRTRRVFLARDRYGIKPLYWYHDGRRFLFGSEIKAILAHPAISAELDCAALNEYFTFQNIFTDGTLFKGIHLLPAGCTMMVDSRHGGRVPEIRRYWDYRWSETEKLSEEEFVDRVYDLLVQSVTRQLVSDVPVGSYLSGGLDSGSITCVAAKHLPRLRTFTGGFDLSSASGLELGFDERANAELLANLYKTEHYEVVMHAGSMEWVLPKLIWHLEDLRVGQSYPNYYAAGLASKFVKVVLSGAGGDELFGGYPWRYFRAIQGDGSEAYFRDYYDFWQRLVPDDDKPRLFNEGVRRELRGYPSSFEIFRGVLSGWNGDFSTREQCVNASLYFELKTFLHGLLVVEDKLSMAHSLETRVPFLDDDFTALALRTPIEYKINLSEALRIDENQPGKRKLFELQSRDGKRVLRKALTRLVPPEVANRTKQGFSAPDASWFRGESIDYINRLLRNRKAAIYDFIEPEYVNGVLEQHCSGQANRRLLIWSLLSFEWWCRTWLAGMRDHAKEVSEAVAEFAV